MIAAMAIMVSAKLALSSGAFLRSLFVAQGACARRHGETAEGTLLGFTLEPMRR